MTTLGDSLVRAAARWPEKTVLVFEGRRWRFAEWKQQANRATHAFAARGIAAGDRVVFLTWNLPEQVAAFFGLLKLGAVPVPINYRLAANEVRYIVEDCGTRILVFEDKLREVIQSLDGVPGRSVVEGAAEGDEPKSVSWWRHSGVVSG